MPAAPKDPKEQVDYGAAFTSSGVSGGLDLGPPLGVAACSECGRYAKDDAGHWAIKLRGDGTPWCGSGECK